jgi:hypothetical protein
MPPDSNTGEVIVDLKPEQMDLLADTVLKQDEFGFDLPADKVEKVDRHRDEETGRFAKKDDGDSELDRLRAQLRDSDAIRTENARLKAEREELVGRVHQTHNNEAEANYATVNTRIQALGEKQATLREKLAMFNSLGDYDNAAVITAQMMEVTADLKADKQLKQSLEARYHENKRRSDAERHASKDPLEVRLAAAQLSPSAKAWLRLHPECILEDSKTTEVARHHNEAVRNGLVPDTRAYFHYIEEQMGFRNAPAHKQQEQANPYANRQPDRDEARTMSPPVSREGGNQNAQQRPNQIKLTAEQVEMARLNGMTNEEYALGVMKMKNEKRDFNSRFGSRR